MFFRLLKTRGIGVFLAAVLMVSCNLSLNDKAPRSATLSPKVGYDSACLSGAGDVFAQFYKGQGDPVAVEALFTCFDGAIDLFGRKVVGEKAEQFTPRELATFFEDFFLAQDVKISDGMLQQMMSIKQMLIGGRADRLTRAELSNLAELSRDVKSMVIELLPVMGVLTFNWKPDARISLSERIATFEKANESIQKVALRLGNRVQSNGLGYQLSNLVPLFDELQGLLQTKWTFVGQLQRVLPLIYDLKKTLVGGDGEIVTPSEWGPFALLASRGYIQYLRYHYFVSEVPLRKEGFEIVFVTRTLDDLFSYLGDLIKSKPSGQFSKADLNRILSSLQKIFPEFRFSSGLIDEVMKLKVVLFGGSEDNWLPAEFDRARAKVDAFRALNNRLYAFLGLYSFTWKPQDGDFFENKKIFKKAEANLQQLALGLGSLLESSYDLKRLEVIGRELDLLFPPKVPSEALQLKIEKYLPTVLVIKEVFLNQAGSVIERNSWSAFLSDACDLYSKYLYYHYFLSKESLVPESAKTQTWTQFISEIFDTLNRVTSREGSTGKFSKADLNRILESLRGVFPDLQISTSLIDEIMALKVAFFGGSEEAWLPSELSRVGAKVEAAQSLVEKFNLYRAIYTLQWNPRESEEAENQNIFKKAEVNLQEIARVLASLLESNYDLKRLQSFARELDRFNPPANGEQSLELTLQKYLPLVVVLKEISLNRPGSRVAQNLWTPFLAETVDIFTKYLHFRYFVESQPSWTGAVGSRVLSQFIVRSLESVERWVGRRASSEKPYIDLKEVDKLAETLLRSQLITSPFDYGKWSLALRFAVRRLLIPPQDRFAGRYPKGINLQTTSVLRAELKVWFETQDFFNRTLQSDEDKRIGAQGLIRALRFEKSPLLVSDLKYLLTSPVSLVMDSSSRLLIAERSSLFDREALVKVALMRSAVRVVLRAYSSRDRLESYEGVRRSEAQVAYRDIAPLLVRWGLVENEDLKFINSRVTEANLFTPHASGDDSLSFGETYDLGLMLWSGVSINSRIERQLRNNCRVENTPRRSISVKCLFQTYRESFRRDFSSLPALALWMSRLESRPLNGGALNPAELAPFEKTLFDMLLATGWMDDQSGMIQLSAASLLPQILQYMEAVLQRFDLSRDGVVQKDEAMEAYKVFRSLMKTVSGVEDERYLRGGFSYILVYGKLPETVAEKVSFLRWINQEATWPVQTDRAGLAKALGFIGVQMNKPKPPAN